MVLPLQEQIRSYHYTGASHWRKNIVAVITQDRVIDDNLKIQTQIFQYIRNCSKAFEFLPTLFIRYT